MENVSSLNLAQKPSKDDYKNTLATNPPKPSETEAKVEKPAGDEVQIETDSSVKLEKIKVDIVDVEPEVKSNVSVETSSQDLTLKTQLGSKWDASLRYYQNSPTMLNGGVLAKVSYQPWETTRFTIGGGYLPNVFAMTVGPNELEKHPTSVISAGITDDRNLFKFNLPLDMKLSGDLNSYALGTLAYDHVNSEMDKGVSKGLLRANTMPSLTLSKDFGKIYAAVSYKQDWNFPMIGEYYSTGGKSIPPVTHFIEGTVSASVTKDIKVCASAYVPLKSYSNEFSKDPLLKITVGAQNNRFIPNVYGKISLTEGIKDAALGLNKTIRVNSWLDASLYAGVGTSKYSDKPEYTAGGGFTFYFDKRSGSQEANSVTNHLMNDWRSAVPLSQQPTTEVYTRGNPSLGTFFTKDEIDKIKDMNLAELKTVLDTPEKVVAYVDKFIKYDDGRSGGGSGPSSTYSPEEVVNLKKGVCRDQHILMVDLLKAQGIEAKQIGYSSAGSTFHAIAAYKDPNTNKWNIIEYGNVHYTQADTMEEAFNTVRPDAWINAPYEDGGSGDRRAKKGVNYSPSAIEYKNFMLDK